MIENIIEGRSVESIMIKILGEIHLNGPISPKNIEALTYIKKFNDDVFSKYEKRLLYLMGMFYKVDEPRGFLEEIYDIYSSAIFEETGIKFTPMQSEARRYINEKKYFSFSAPTSSGKSFLFRRLISECQGDIIIVVPSRALVSEYMSLVLDMVDKTVLVLQFIENINIDKIDKRIYIITPERGGDLFSLIDELNVELILLDEAQISEEDIRGLKFDSFVRRLERHLPKAHKVFAHPFVSNPEAQLKKHGYNDRDNATSNLYKQHTVGKMFLTIEDGVLKHFSPYDDRWTKEERILESDLIGNLLETEGTVLIYISKAKIISGEYIELFSKYIDKCPKVEDPIAIQLINELKQYIGANEGEKYSLLIHMMEKGIVVHHGSIPLKARLIIEEFVRNNYAKMCFATSTLNQGINMPFDLVWIDNFWHMDTLTLKNLIGRAGRSSMRMNLFDYGYVVLNRENRDTFISRINEDVEISDISKLDEDFANISIDELDLVKAMKGDTFDDELKLTEEQVSRLDVDAVDFCIELILDNMLVCNEPINAKQYYDIPSSRRRRVKDSFKKLYILHLRKEELTKSEATILSASIPILLWHIQGKSFSEVVSLRYAYISEKDKRRTIRKRIGNGEITAEEGRNEMLRIPPKYSCRATSLPNSKALSNNLFGSTKSILDIDYDTLVYDTYDYLDKVISLSLVNPLCAAFQLYTARTDDSRGEILADYIRYGTNDETEMWLLKYGFPFEDIEWIKSYVLSVNQNRIDFSEKISELDEKKLRIIERYI